MIDIKQRKSLECYMNKLLREVCSFNEVRIIFATRPAKSPHAEVIFRMYWLMNE